jgi:hypothetical protein
MQIIELFITQLFLYSFNYFLHIKNIYSSDITASLITIELEILVFSPIITFFPIILLTIQALSFIYAPSATILSIILFIKIKNININRINC